MKKAIILAGLLLAMAHTAFAEQQGVFMQFYRRINPEKNMSVNRAPMRLPINVYGTLKDLEDALLTSLDKPIDKINLRL